MAPLNQLQQQAHHTRLDLALAQQQVQVSQRQIALAQANRVPDLALAAAFIWDPTVETSAALLGVRVELPLFNSRQAEVTQAEATLTFSQAQVQALEQQVDQEVALAYQDLQSNQRLLDRDRSVLLPQAEQVLNLARKSYQFGQSSLTEVLVAEQSVQEQQDAFYSDLLAYQTAQSALERAINQPLSP